ncbi:MAG: DUF58 domain-containing protein [Luteitalea sp.]|nr:DUF58 domain-containing protein [Luteitalea sp.]
MSASASAGAPVRQFLDPAVVARLGTLELKARTIVEGFLSGLHRSPFKGFSVEFAEYRQYIHGDDLSTIDWKVYARSDRHYVKKFEEETNLDCHVMLDVSASMSYGSAGMTKYEYGQCLAASLGYLMNRQRDRVGLTAFDDRIVGMLPPSAKSGHLRTLLITLDRLQIGSRTNFAKPLHQLAESLTKRGMVVVISDLLDDPERVIRGLRHFQFRGTDVIVFHVLDPHETEFPFERPTRFEDLETSEEVMAVPVMVRAAYLDSIGGLIARYRRELGACGIDYHLLSTAQPLELALMAYLSTRGRAL